MKNFQSPHLLLVTFLFLLSCKSTNYLTEISATKIQVASEDNLKEDPAILKLIEPYKVELDSVMNEVIGESAVDLIKARPESNLGNWMADAIHRKAEAYLGEKIDFALQNYGGIRIPVIKKGPITRGKIYELMPFDNKISILYLEKAKVEELIQHFLNSRTWPVSFPLKVKKLSEEDIQVTINGNPLTENQIYKIALPDYIANGGSRTDFLQGAKRKDLNILVRDALIADVQDFAAKSEPLDYQVSGRIIIKN